MFNHRHLSIRNVVERTFGVFKKRFPFLGASMPSYSFIRQCDILIACCVIHNYIRDHDMSDPLFFEFDHEDVNADNGQPYSVDGDGTRQYFSGITSEQLQEWSTFRDNIANELWVKYNMETGH